MSVLESWVGVRAWVMPERKRVEFWVWRGGDCYKMEIAFENIVESVGCCVGGDKVNALRLKVKFFFFSFLLFEFLAYSYCNWKEISCFGVKCDSVELFLLSRL